MSLKKKSAALPIFVSKHSNFPLDNVIFSLSIRFTRVIYSVNDAHWIICHLCPEASKKEKKTKRQPLGDTSARSSQTYMQTKTLIHIEFKTTTKESHRRRVYFSSEFQVTVHHYREVKAGI